MRSAVDREIVIPSFLEESEGRCRPISAADSENAIYAKRVVCETSVGYAVYSAEGKFLAFVDSLGDAMIAARHYNIPLSRVH